MTNAPGVLVLALLLLSACASPAAGPIPSPSPTIAAPPVRPSPTPAVPAALATRPPIAPAPATTPPVARPTATPPAGSPAPPAPTATPAPFAYLWPTYLPANMRISPSETRVAREGEAGPDGLGFFIVTFNDGARKLVVGGGATELPPLSGEQRRLTVGGREATLTTSGDRRQLAFAVPRGSLFVYGSHLSEDELLRVAGSLQPIDVQDLRALVGAG